MNGGIVAMLFKLILCLWFEFEIQDGRHRFQMFNINYSNSSYLSLRVHVRYSSYYSSNSWTATSNLKHFRVYVFNVFTNIKKLPPPQTISLKKKILLG